MGPVPLARLHARRARDGGAEGGRRAEPARPRRDAPPRVHVPGCGALMPRAVLTGGAGFLGSHLATDLRGAGYNVVAVDDLSTGSAENVAHLADDPGFTMLEHDVSAGLPVDGPVDAVLQFASPARPQE